MAIRAIGSAGAREAMKSLLVAVVDDNDSVRESLPPLLRGLGFAAKAFESAEEFLSSEDMCRTQCLLLDISMPGMSGPELQQELMSRGIRVPIIFITAHADASIREQLVRRGAAACLFKPFSEKQLQAALDTALSQADGSGAEHAPLSEIAPVVFVVDDDPSVRESLAALLAGAGYRHEEFASADAFLAHPGHRVMGCLVLDLSMPDLNGLDLQERLAADDALPIIFITGHGDIPTAVRAMKAGAVEFLAKPYEPEVILRAIARAMERSRATFQERLALQRLRDRHDSLTLRERQVMALVVRGRLNKQVGGDLGISEITVKAHRGRAIAKMGARSLPELVEMASRLGLPIAGEIPRD